MAPGTLQKFYWLRTKVLSILPRGTVIRCDGVQSCLKQQFKSAPHISPGALCAACDPMAIQPGSGLPPKGISFVHEALGLPARAISFMGNSGLFSGFIKIDEKTNKNMDSGILLATP